MKKTSIIDPPDTAADELASEYRFDYKKAKPNRFASTSSRVVILDEDIAQVFTTPEAVNKVLRAFIEAIPTELQNKQPCETKQ